MGKARGTGFAGIAYRHSSPRHATIDGHTLAASSRAGGRFNGAKEFGALYLSLDPETALRELRRACDRAGTPLHLLLPRILFAVEVRLQRIADLTTPGVSRRWKIPRGALRADDWTACQSLARRLRDDGYEAVRFPSAAGEGENLAVYADRLLPGSSLRVVREEQIRLRPP